MLDLDVAERLDVELLGERLIAATEWAGEHPDLASLQVGYFGASTGAAASRPSAASAAPRLTFVSVMGWWSGQSLEHEFLPSIPGNRGHFTRKPSDSNGSATAQLLPERQFLLGGSGWDGKPLPSNVRLAGHVYTRDLDAFNGTVARTHAEVTAHQEVEIIAETPYDAEAITWSRSGSSRAWSCDVSLSGAPPTRRCGRL